MSFNGEQHPAYQAVQYDPNSCSDSWLMNTRGMDPHCAYPGFVDPSLLDPPPMGPAAMDPALIDPALTNPALIHHAVIDPALYDPTPLDPTPLDPTPLDPTPLDPLPLDPLLVDPNATAVEVGPPTVTVYWGSIKVNGRSYVSPDKYLLPDDEKEKDRLDFGHEVFLLTFNALNLAPVAELLRPGGKWVLDIGTGTGIWAIDFANEHKQTLVLGVDLSPIQPTNGPKNVTFQVRDVEMEWNRREKYSYIHGRMLSPCFTDPERIIQKAVNALEPGGYLELQDIFLDFVSEDNSLQGTLLMEWLGLVHAGARQLGQDWMCARNFKQYMENAGLEEVKEVHRKWLVHVPHKLPCKIFGVWCLVTLMDALEAFSPVPLGRGLGMPNHEIQKMVAGMKQELKNPKIKFYIPVIAVYGRKPLKSVRKRG